MAELPIQPNEVTTEIQRVAKEVPALEQAFNGKKHLGKIIEHAAIQQSEFVEKGGKTFDAGRTAEETAKNFVDANIKQGVNASLPGSAIDNSKRMNLDPNSPGHKASVAIATMAENTIGQGTLPEYHQQNHFREVGEYTRILIEESDRMVREAVPGAIELNANDKGLLAAISPGHDLAHGGKSNPADNHYANETKSFELMKPVLKDAGFSDVEIARADTIIKTTSPNGAHAVLKGVAQAHQDNITNGRPAAEGVDWNKIDPDGKFPELKVLVNDPKLTHMAAILSDADLYASSAAGMDASIVKSAALSRETGMNLTTDGARKFFFDNIVGPEPTSAPGKRVGGDSYKELQKETISRLEAQKKTLRRQPRP